jgi:hypothetical protein
MTLNECRDLYLGKFVTVPSIPENRNEDPTFPDDMNYLVDEKTVLEVVDVNYGYGEDPQLIVLDSSKDQHWYLAVNWAQIENNKTPIQACECTMVELMNGCKCGAFKSEMQARGLIYDKWAKSWVKP